MACVLAALIYLSGRADYGNINLHCRVGRSLQFSVPGGPSARSPPLLGQTSPTRRKKTLILHAIIIVSIWLKYRYIN